MTPQDQLGFAGESRGQYDTFISHLSVQGYLRSDTVIIVEVVVLSLQREGSDLKIGGLTRCSQLRTNDPTSGSLAETADDS